MLFNYINEAKLRLHFIASGYVNNFIVQWSQHTVATLKPNPGYFQDSPRTRSVNSKKQLFALPFNMH